ncbi:MAG TPA: Rossmann-like and DUF2520 domain-containing protein [Acidimicrobiia bacterium]|nr:Rossmann-like and DUF2520 domain-containing protein [Acidimicrobiia bacterium]
MNLVLVGPGRAGGSMAIAATRSGDRIVGVLSRSGDSRYGPALSWDDPLPFADLLLIAVNDAAIEEVARRLAGVLDSIPVAAHVSGFTPVSALEPLAAAGAATGGFHPLQTLPDPERGAAALAGAFVGIGGHPHAQAVLTQLARSLEMRPFPLSDASRPRYHAGASAASNFVVTALATAGDLMSAAGIEPGVARPLVEQAVANVYDDLASALTGPVARGDVATVSGQLAAARETSDDIGDQYRLMAEATAIRAGRRADIQKWR